MNVQSTRRDQNEIQSMKARTSKFIAHSQMFFQS